MNNRTAAPDMSSARAIPFLVVLAAICQSAVAGDTYTIHENLHVGDRVTYTWNSTYKEKSTSSTNGNATVTDTEAGHQWKLTLTDQDVKNGSAMRVLAVVDPSSVDTLRVGGDPVVTTLCPFGGNSIIIRRRADDSLTNFFQGKASDDDNDLLNNFISPDQAWYPEKPVAVGDTWDDSDKTAKFSSLGPKDRIISQGRLDSVKMIDGKQLAQISHSYAIVYHLDGNVEEDQQFTATQLVDVASGVIIKFDETGTIKYVTAKTEPTQVSGGGEITIHVEAKHDAAAAPATQP